MQSEWLNHQLTDQEREAFDRDQEGLAENARINYLEFIGRDREFMDLLDCHTTFPKVWNIQLYHSHLIWTPPLQPGEPDPGYNWHKESGRLNQELKTDPQPRISLKVAYFLMDTSVPCRPTCMWCPAAI